MGTVWGYKEHSRMTTECKKHPDKADVVQVIKVGHYQEEIKENTVITTGLTQT